MTQERYKEIRQMPNFLHLYFVEETGQGIAQQQFDHLFNTWLMSIIGMHPIQGIEKIHQYLDKQLRN